MGDEKDTEYMSVAVEEPGKKTANNTNSRGKPASIRAHGVKCMKRRTTLEKFLLFLLLIVLCFVLLLIIVLVTKSKKGKIFEIKKKTKTKNYRVVVSAFFLRHAFLSATVQYFRYFQN